MLKFAFLGVYTYTPYHRTPKLDSPQSGHHPFNHDQHLSPQNTTTWQESHLPSCLFVWLTTPSF